MTAPVVAFFNNKGGVGKTSLVFHIGWMAAELGLRVLFADLDPQANLTAAFLPEERLEEIWPIDGDSDTVFGAVRPLLAVGGLRDVRPLAVGEGRYLLAGDIALSRFEDELADSWSRCLGGNERAFHITTALWRVITRCAAEISADVILVDVGPSLGALNRAALVAADDVVIPLAPDLFSVQGLRNLGPTLRTWRAGWQQRAAQNPNSSLSLPTGSMRAAGYILLQHGIRLGKPTRAFQRWMDRVPAVYRSSVLDEPGGVVPRIEDDELCLAQLKNYASLMPMAQDARKPVFALTAADGAFGGHQQAAQRAFSDFRQLTRQVLGATGVLVG
ncbi:MAG TPA: ParA family protein [Pseudonocardiaceae bacterium]|nr:ParA family protein [Pseudonocardiaceae bacterium]